MDRPWRLASPTHEARAHPAGEVGSHAFPVVAAPDAALRVAAPVVPTDRE
jgi:hypothetical protein